jgi:XTP/dITP diphosphohydrolase
MVKAMRLQEKAKQVGFEWENKEQVWDKVEEEMRELKQAIAQADTAGPAEKEQLKDAVEDELGDVFFSLVNYARFLQVDADNALERTNKKFIHRFTSMEEQALNSGKDLHSMTLEEMDAIWNNIKQQRQAHP